jgi:amidophosphoribosyltransferase
MSDSIKHECGIAMVRLRKPLSYYIEKYGTALYGINKMYLLMEKQHNRGQDGAGLATIKLNMPPGHRYISRYRSVDPKPIQDIFTYVQTRIQKGVEARPELLKNPDWLKHNLPFTGEILLGHLRYGTYGKNAIENTHPFLRQNNWMSRNVIVAGNFNMTNNDQLFDQLVDLGQHPKEKVDTVTVMEKIGHFLDEANEKLYREFKKQGHAKKEISHLIAKNLNVGKVLKRASKKWDGGYAIAGMFGYGDSFVLRDPNSIRPAYFYKDDEVVVVASERPVIQTAFNVPFETIQEIPGGNALIMKKNGDAYLEEIRKPKERRACSFERIYFSRGNDKEIYEERLKLGRRLIPVITRAVDHDLENTVFSFIPNTAEIAFYGMVKGIEDLLKKNAVSRIREAGEISDELLGEIVGQRARVEKIAWKDVKLRTFITEDNSRDDLVSHVYDVTYGQVKPSDNLVVIDDSIVRGTTLKHSIFKILDRLGPKKIIVASSAPQIRYPDCYGIDMAKMGDFIAFRAAIALLKESGRQNVIDEVYAKCKAQENHADAEVRNYVRDIYASFTPDEISVKIAELLKPQDIRAEVEVVYQSIEALHESCPNNLGDWYFTGNFPTPGGNRVMNKSFINWCEGKNERAY